MPETILIDGDGVEWEILGFSTACGPAYADLKNEKGEMTVRVVSQLRTAGKVVPQNED